MFDSQPETGSEPLLCLDNLPPPAWLAHGRPRLAVNQIIADRYRVIRVKQATEKHQLLHVVGSVPEKVQLAHVVKVINRAVVSEIVMRAQLNWLYNGRDLDGRCSLICDFMDGNQLHYLIFHRHPCTLAKVLSENKLWPLPDSHLHEIFLQLISALKCMHRLIPAGLREVLTHTVDLHNESRVNSDLCPENVEFVDTYVTTQSEWDDCSATFFNKPVLSSTNVRLSYYGDIGLRHIMTGTDQYRAPEVVFSHRATYATDCFSLGCLLGEIALGFPLFPPCERGPLYEREKVLLFNAITGPFSQDAAARIETVFPHTFDEITIKPICYKGLSQTIISEVNKSLPIRWMMDDMHLAEVIEGLACTNPDQRLGLDDLLECDFFSDSSENNL